MSREHRAQAHRVAAEDAATGRLLDRRRFLGAAATAAAAATFLGTRPLLESADARTCTTTVPDSKIGIQLFTCTVANAANREATLTRIADIGYKLVEHAGYGNNAAAFRASLDAVGLKCISGHTGFPRPYDDARWRTLVQDALVIGQRHIVWPSASGSSVADWVQVAKIMNRCGKVARAEGLGTVGYHNHGAEYQPIQSDPKKRRPIDILMAVCDPEYTHQQMDIGWCWSVANPVAELRRYKGRYRQFHVKDMVGIPQEQRPAALQAGVPIAGGPVVPGAGLVDFPAVFAAAKETKQPIVSYLIENDGSVATCFDAALAGYQLLHGMEYSYRC